MLVPVAGCGEGWRGACLGADAAAAAAAVDGEADDDAACAPCP